MNILDAAFRIGQNMSTIPEGREWFDLYTVVSQSISSESWDTFLQIPKGFMHYYSFPYAWNVVEENSKREDLPKDLKGQLTELIASQSLKQLCDLSLKLGNNLNLMITSILAPHPIPKNFGQLQASLKLIRSIQDMHFVFQRAGLVRQMFRYLDPRRRAFPDVVDTFQQEKKSFTHPLHRGIRRVIRALGSTEEQLRLLKLVHMSDLLLDLARQMVFESHLGQVVFVPNENIVRCSVRDVYGIHVIFLGLNELMLPLMQWHGHFITLRFAGASGTAIITRCQMRFGQVVSGGFKMHMMGYLYPNSDEELINRILA
jgi:hypothetical protein